jgi:hypothetical protein
MDNFMIYFWQSHNLNEHRVISDYLYSALLNLDDHRNKLTDNLKRNVDELRATNNIPDEVTDKEIEMTAFGLDLEDVPEGSKWISVYGVSEDIHFTYEFEQLLFQSYFFLWYGFVERRLKDLLKIIDPEKKQNANRRQGFIHQFHAYLEKELDYKIDDTIWNELILISLLRNTLIHYGNDLPVDETIDIETLHSNYDKYVAISSKLLEYIKLKGIYKSGNGSIVLNRDFCFYLIKFSEKLFGIIGNDLRERAQ